MAYYFVDESKSRGYSLVAVEVDGRRVAAVRSVMRQMLLAGQERVHFTKERDSRRRTIVSRMATVPLRVVVFTSTAREREARTRCLTQLVSIAHESSHFVIEQDDSLREEDARQLSVLVRSGTSHHSFELVAARHDPGLWCADAMAWPHQRGGEWTARVAMHEWKRVVLH